MLTEEQMAIYIDFIESLKDENITEAMKKDLQDYNEFFGEIGRQFSSDFVESSITHKGICLGYLFANFLKRSELERILNK